MAKLYHERLSTLLAELKIDEELTKTMEVKYYFSGAALYVNQAICASWSPVGLAFKMPETEAKELINSGKAIPLKYFPKGHVKKGYALFENPDAKKTRQWKKYFITSAAQV